LLHKTFPHNARRAGIAFFAGIIAAAANLSNSYAEVPANSVAEVKAAYAEMDTLAKSALQSGSLPVYSDPAAKPVMDRLWNPGLAGKSPYSGADIPALMEIFQIQNTVLQSYAFFAKPGEKPDVERNTALFQNEIARNNEAILALSAAFPEAFEDFWNKLPESEKTDVRRDGIRKVKGGSIEFLTGQMQMLSSSGLAEEPAKRISAAIAKEMPALSKMFSLSERKNLSTLMASTAIPLGGEVKANIDNAAQALGGSDCNSLCQIE
jgi:hypothetical protein